MADRIEGLGEEPVTTPEGYYSTVRDEEDFDRCATDESRGGDDD